MGDKYAEEVYRFLRGMDPSQIFSKRIKKEEKVDEDGYVVCVCCGASTQYKKGYNVIFRIHYHPGRGQFCHDCEKNQRS